MYYSFNITSLEIMKEHYLTSILLLVIAFSQSQVQPVGSAIIQNSSICNIGECTMLTANYSRIYSTTDYTVARNSEFSPFPFTGGTNINVPPAPNNDDFWADIVRLPFAFSYYNQSYTDVHLSSNGLISFASHAFAEPCYWLQNSSYTLPNTDIYPNSIYGVYQDIHFFQRTQISSINYYILDTGINAAPNRVFVYNVYEMPMFPAPSAPATGLQTSQIVLHETTNIIEVNVLKRVPSIAWSEGAGLIGIQNSNATKFSVPPGRNTGAWTAQNESWLFLPGGVEVPAFQTWSQGGVEIGSGEQISVCPTQQITNYELKTTYTTADGSILTATNNHSVTVGQLIVGEPNNLFVCGDQQTVNLAVNSTAVAANEAVEDFTITYYITLADAVNDQYSNRIVTPANFVFSPAGQTIYMNIRSLFGSGCSAVKQFQITVQDAAIPTGDANQYFTPGQTLNDLEVTGTNIIWYDAETGGNLLPATTLLQDGVTYYAENANSNSCETKQALAQRLAVTVHFALANSSFNKSKLTVYPNPANGLITVSYSENLSRIEIYNAFGQLVKTQNATDKELKLDVSYLANGVYFAKIASGNNNTTVKIVKN